jgi:hypothetical protein
MRQKRKKPPSIKWRGERRSHRQQIVTPGRREAMLRAEEKASAPLAFG